MRKDRKELVCRVCYIIMPLLLWLLNGLYSKTFFDEMSVETKPYFVTRIVLLILLYLLEYVIRWCVLGVGRGEEAVKLFVKVFLIVFLVYGVWFIISYPGAWGWDGYTILEYTKKGEINYWTSLLTSVVYFLGLMIFPSPISVLILQMVFCALLVSRVIYIVFVLTNSKKLAYILIIPCVLPVTIMYVLSPVRAILFALLSLCVCFEFLHLMKVEKITWIEWICFSILIALVAFWRSEGVIFCLLPLCLIFAKRNSLKLKKGLIFCAISICMVFLMKKLTISNYQYMITSLYYPIQHMVQTDELDYEGVEEDLEKINVVFNVEVMRKSYSDPAGGFNQQDFAYGKEGFHPEQATEEEYHEMLHGFISLVFHKPLLFVKVRLQTFFGSMQQNGFVVDYISAYDKSAGSNFQPENYLFFERWNVSMQNILLSLLSFKVGNIQIPIIATALNNMLFPIIALILLFFYELIKRNWEYVLIAFLYIGITVGTIIFEPLGQPMYYLHQYIMGYFLLIFILGKNMGKGKLAK